MWNWSIGNLKRSVHEIHIPEAVFREVTAKEDSACVQIKSSQDWIHVESIQDVSHKKMYKAKLHDGEVDEMKHAGFYVSDTLEQFVLEQAEE